MPPEIIPTPPKYSIVVPLHNEAASIRELHERLSRVMTGHYEPVEFVYIDDHSADGTAAILAELAAIDPRILLLRLKRNYGQTTALAAGFDYASGEIIISMDGDLQHDPNDIPIMLKRSNRLAATSSAAGARSASTISSSAVFRRAWRTG